MIHIMVTLCIRSETSSFTRSPPPPSRPHPLLPLHGIWNILPIQKHQGCRRTYLGGNAADLRPVRGIGKLGKDISKRGFCGRYTGVWVYLLVLLSCTDSTTIHPVLVRLFYSIPLIFFSKFLALPRQPLSGELLPQINLVCTLTRAINLTLLKVADATDLCTICTQGQAYGFPEIYEV